MYAPIIAITLLTLTACGQTGPKTGQVAKQSRDDSAQKQQKPMLNYSPSPEKANPTAKKLMNEDFYWSPIEESAPFGSDDAADAYAGFAEWRQAHKNDNPKMFLIEQIQTWGYPTFDLNETDFEKLKPYLKKSDLGTRFMSGTDAAISAIAFGQLYLEGTIDKDFKLIAITSIRRQLDPQMLSLWGENYKPTREAQLRKMLHVLEEVK